MGLAKQVRDSTVHEYRETILHEDRETMIDRESRELLIVGISGRAAAQSAVRGGLVPVVIDAFADTDTARICAARRVADFPSGLLAASIEVGPRDWLYTGGMENHPRLVEQLGCRHRLLGVDADALRPVRDPWEVARCLRSAGLPTPRLVEGSSPPSDGEFLWKLRSSGGGLGIKAHAPRRGKFAPLGDPEKAYFQERIPGRSYSATFLADGRRSALVGLTRQWIGRKAWGAVGFQYSGSRTVGRWPCDPRRLTDIGGCLATGFGLKGLFGVDLIAHAGDMYLVEVNPRYAASCELLERRIGTSLVQLHAEVCRSADLGSAIDECLAHRPNAFHYGKAIVYARGATVIREPLIEGLMRGWSVRDWPPWSDIPRANTTIDAGQPILTAFAAARDERLVRFHLDRRVAAVNRWLAPWRNSAPCRNTKDRPG